MPEQKLTIVPVRLHPESNNTSAVSPERSSKPACSIKTAAAEIFFFNGVEEHIIKTVMRELKQW